ncbi:MAG: STAS domain-containing protein [Alphaproteobacteria bacterium]|nr:STAS domain-containing protein [Alphaproteobacteria bacterium]
MSATLCLPPRCTLVQAEGIAAECRNTLSAGDGGLLIDASCVEEADVTLLQILMAARQSCEAAGRDFALTSSPALATLAARAGFSVTATGLTTPV